jgi:UDP:flavonoid glycosyltransferase YjiC (YdhE family)
MRWLLTSWGSSGDLHPFLALGRGLIARGHEVTLVGHPDWAAESAEAGLRFVATAEGPRDRFLEEHPEVMSTRRGGLPSLRSLVEKGMAPGFSAILRALTTELPGHDAIVAHHFVFPAPLASEICGKPLITVCLSPSVTPSAYGRPGPHSGRVGHGPASRLFNRLIWTSGKFVTRAVVDPLVNELRREQGLSPIRDAVFSAHSTRLNLQLYSRHFAGLAPDWSAEKKQAGFCFYDPPATRLPPDLEQFLAAGAPPVLVTLGSAAVHVPGSFFVEAAAALQRLYLRGVLLHGPTTNRPADLPENIFALSSAPFGLLMPRMRAVMHQCGIGTLSHALRAGLASVACPFAFDQPNNARRLEALGVAEVLPAGRRWAAQMAAALRKLLEGPATEKARRLGERIRAEDGVGEACHLLEDSLAG